MKSQNSRGFTLVEIIVALAIIGLLATVVVGGLSGSREKARDTKRVSDLGQIQIALRLFSEQNDMHLSYAGGIDIGSGASLDTDLAPYLSRIPADPMQGGNFTYHYDSSVTCTAPNQRVLFARTAETVAMQNFTDVCTTASVAGFDGGNPTDGFIILLR